MCHHGEEKQTEDTVLRGCGAEWRDPGEVAPRSHRLGSAGEEDQQLVPQGVAETEGSQFAHQVLWNAGVKC